MVVSEDVLLLPPSVSGDFVVLPVSSPEFEEKHGGNVGTTLGERLLLLCSVDAEPMPVDPISPRLPAEALGELSPYVSWFSFYRQGSEYLRTDLPGTPPRIFDLRTGVSLDIQVENPEDRDHPVEVQVAGTRAAWLVGSGDRSSGTIYLADLEGLTAEAVVRVEAPDMELMDWALSEHWLVWIDAGGRCLHAVHLPDMESAVVRGVVGESERAQVQVSGDVVLLDVRYPSPSMAVNLRAHAGALRVVRLPSAAETSTR